MKENLYIASAIAALVSIGIGLFTGYAALQHNPNNQFCMHSEENCTLDWMYLLSIVFSWMVVIFAVQAFCIFSFALIWRLGVKKPLNKLAKQMRYSNGRRSLFNYFGNHGYTKKYVP